MSTRSITLNAAQVRTVLLGIADTDDQRRGFAVGVIADALLAVDDPQPDQPSGTADDEHERRRQRVERAAAAVVACWPAGSGASIAELHDAVEALREYTPADIAGPES